MRLRPATAEALRLPAIGLGALGLFSVGLLAGAVWLEWAAGVLFVIVGIGAWIRTHSSGPREQRRPAPAAGQETPPSSSAASSRAIAARSHARSA